MIHVQTIKKVDVALVFPINLDVFSSRLEHDSKNLLKQNESYLSHNRTNNSTMMNQVLDELERDFKRLSESEKDELESGSDILSKVQSLPTDGEYTKRDVSRVCGLSLVVISHLENMVKSGIQDKRTGINDEVVSLCLEVLLCFIRLLPVKLMQVKSQDEANENQTGSILITEIDPNHREPIGLDLILICSSIQILNHQNHPNSHSKAVEILQNLNAKLKVCEDSKTDALLSIYLRKYVNEIRDRLLPVFKTFRDRSDRFESIQPSFEERFYQGKHLVSILHSLEITSKVVQNLIPLILFLMDDFDSRVAVLGVEALQIVISTAPLESLKSWAQILQNTIGDRLLASDIEVWRELAPVACLLGKRVRCKELTGVLFDQMLKRLATDVEPYEFGFVFLKSASTLVEVLNLDTVQFFSELFPMLTQWMLLSSCEVQIEALGFLTVVIESTRPRIERHAQIIHKVLQLMENNAKTHDSLKSSITTAKEALEASKQVTQLRQEC